MKGNQSITIGKFGLVHHCPTFQRGTKTAQQTLIHHFIFFPIMHGTAAFSIGNTIPVADFLNLSLATLLVGILFRKFYFKIERINSAPQPFLTIFVTHT